MRRVISVNGFDTHFWGTPAEHVSKFADLSPRSASDFIEYDPVKKSERVPKCQMEQEIRS